jgi:hypothetical protein
MSNNKILWASEIKNKYAAYRVQINRPQIYIPNNLGRMLPHKVDIGVITDEHKIIFRPVGLDDATGRKIVRRKHDADGGLLVIPSELFKYIKKNDMLGVYTFQKIPGRNYFVGVKTNDKS